MKTILRALKRLIHQGQTVVGAATVLACAGLTTFPSTGRAQLGDTMWDFSMSGSGHEGITYILFENDGTLRGYHHETPKGFKSSPPTARGGSAGRGGSTSGNKSGDLLIGFGALTGHWGVNGSGQIVGFFSLAGSVSKTTTNFAHCVTTNLDIFGDGQFTTNLDFCFTNTSADFVTNLSFTSPTNFSTNFTFTSTDSTVTRGTVDGVATAVSFRGKLSGARLTLVGDSPDGKFTYRGVPAVSLQDLSGSWVGLKTHAGLPFNEFFDVTSAQTTNPFTAFFPDASDFPNIYFTTNGLGPDYTFNGILTFSVHKTIGFAYKETHISDGSTVLRSTIGTVKNDINGTHAKTSGFIDPGDVVKFNADRISGP